MSGKTCRTCGEDKPKEDFHNCRRQGHQSRCKACRSRVSAEKYKTSEKLRHQLRNGHYVNRYGITYDQVLLLRDLQKNICALCEGVLMGGRYEHVDHDHQTGAVRGILCSECNTGIGKLKDNPALLRKAASYIENPPSFDVATQL